MTAALAELQDEWNGREASDVVGLVQSALALVDLYEGASVAQGASEDADGLKAALLATRKALKDRCLNAAILQSLSSHVLTYVSLPLCWCDLRFLGRGSHI